MDDDECIKIYKDEILHEMLSNKSGNYELFGYSFHGLFVDIFLSYDVQIENNDEPYSFGLFIYCESGTNNDEKDLLLFTQIFLSKTVEENINGILKFLLHEFRQSFTYSKILDEIVLNDNKIYKEKRKIARIKLMENVEIDKCCVCYDYNNIYTSCCHNLCRVCIFSILRNAKGEEMPKCPMCRTVI
jgi:hypothetical protein